MTPGQLRRHVAELAPRVPAARFVTGFDGFVDEMITLVEERASPAEFRRVETIARFGELLSAAAGHSSLREIVVTRTEAGGCAVNLGDGLASLGAAVETFATVGEPAHPAFAPYAAKAALHSWGRVPGRTLAFEFADGKTMFSAVAPLAEFDAAHARRMAADGAFARACAAADAVALTDWTLFPHMTGAWAALREEVFARLPRRPRFFFDLVDPSSRAPGDILAMLDELALFEACGPTTLGLNQTEANILCRLTGAGPAKAAAPAETAAQAAGLRARLGLAEVVVHAVREAAAATAEGLFVQPGPYCARPVKLTGAGDRFNAGYLLAHALGLEADARLLLGGAASGLYVRTGRSPTLPELLAFLDRWEAAPPGAEPA